MRNRRCTHRERRNSRYAEYQLKKNLEESRYRYQPTQTAVSYAEFVIHDFYNLQCRYGGGQLIGVQALKEAVMFLKTYESIFKKSQRPKSLYHLALKVSLRKIWGQRFMDVNETPSIIRTVEDVEQCIRETLRAANITIPVDVFLMQYA